MMKMIILDQRRFEIYFLLEGLKIVAIDEPVLYSQQLSIYFPIYYDYILVE